MKLTMILLTVAFMQVQAAGFSQKITFTGRNVPVEEIFDIISQQTGYTVFANKDLLKHARRITIEAYNMPLQQFLAAALKDQPLQFTIAANTVVLARKPVVADPGMPELEAPVPITGVVLDAEGKPITGASVTIKGTSTGTVTDANGRFSLNVNLGATLVITSIGYNKQEVKIERNQVYSVRLNLTNVEIDSFTISSVNTGYQRIRPEHSTGATSQISTKEYESRVSTNFLDGLVNRLPGLMINNDITFSSNVNGVTTSRSLFNIRGISTMAASAEPLIVIDGYPTELTLTMIDPNEIKSVTILKDAAAATIYGVRAANGVIVIERKQADQGKPKISIRATTGITPKENYGRYRWADDASAIATTYQKDLYSRSITTDTWGQIALNSSYKGAYSPVYYILAQQAAKMITTEQAAQSLANLQNYNNADEYTRLFKRAALTQTYNANVSGGNANALYYITANYTGNRLSSVKNDDNRILLSGRSIITFSRRLSLELTTDYQEQTSNMAPVPDVTSGNAYEHYVAANGRPNYFTSGSDINPFYNATLIGQGLLDNMYYPLTDLNEISNKTRIFNNRTTANFHYNIGYGLDLQFGGIYETSRSDYRHLAGENSTEVRQMVNGYTTVGTNGNLIFNIPKGAFLQQESTNTSSYTGRTQLNYNKKIAGDHTVNAILGAEIRNVKNSSNVASYFGYNDQTLFHQSVDWTSINNGAIKNTYGLSSTLQNSFTNYFDQGYIEDRFLSGYSNIVYSYKNTYSVTGSARIDQSNLFGTNPKYKYKPLWSVGAAWNIHKEDFLKQISLITLLKLRAAYGFNGNVAKASLPQVIAKTVANTITSPTTTALNKVSYANSSLRWEQTKNLNIGIDYQFGKNISGTLDYYRKTSTDLLGNSQIDPTIGVSPTLLNMASITNKGLELNLHADWISTPKTNWNTGLVISHNTSKVTNVYQSFKTTDNQLGYNPLVLNERGFVKGYPVGAVFAYRFAGLDSIGYPLVKNTKGNAYHTNIATTGSASYYTLTADTSDIVYYMGSSIPATNIGFSNRVDIGNFYVFCMVNYYGGFKVRVPRPNPSAARPLEGAGNYWKQRGDEQTTDVMALAGYTSTYANYAYNYSDKYVVNGDYITLADLTVSYSLDNMAFVKKAGLTHFEIKLQGSNLYTIGLNKYNYSTATGSYQKSYVTPTYTLAIFANL